MENRRNLKDAALLASIALPNATATTVTAGIDLTSTPGAALPQQAEAVVQTTAALGVDTKTIAISLEDSADNVTFAAIAALLGTQTLTCAGVVYPATEFRFALPPSGVRRYIRATATGVSGGGNAGNGTMELSLRF